MIKLYLDIETIPGPEELRKEISEELIPPANLKTLWEISKWREKENEKKYRDTALNGDFGQILCIGYIKETLSCETENVIKGEECQILENFWHLAKDVDQFIGHNILDFDLKFIWKRSVIHKIKPSIKLSFARYRSDVIYDTMQEWEKWHGYVKLDKLAKIFGLPSSKETLDGSKVYDYYKEGKLQAIYDYCLKDVELTRKIYKRMNFIL
ncbi:ribonuclease H-like domain-containing protein [candidate division WOR-3 bacterium]|nr:ribonuclease H-like domain-containing protein [candidate division WOR-3 bacterium]